MPSIYFYADRNDASVLVSAILADDRLEVWETSSRVNRPLRRIESAASYADVAEEGAGVSLYAPDMGGTVVHRRVYLRPDLFEAGAHRFLFEGWGVVHLQFAFQPVDHLWESRVTCNSESRARTWADTIHDLGDPSDWNWRAVQREFRRVGSLVRRLAVLKVGGAGVLRSVREKVSRGEVTLNRAAVIGRAV